MVDRRVLARGPALTGPAHRGIFQTPIKSKYKNMKGRISWFKHYNVIQITPSIQIIYETKEKGFLRFHYLYLDLMWINLGISISIIKED
jgi:hypothetical protein